VPRLGGDAAAARFLQLTELLDSEEPIEQGELRRLHAEAVDASITTLAVAGCRSLTGSRGER
jgi:hypothetical protein